MKSNNHATESTDAIGAIYDHLNPQEQEAAQENLRRYLALVLRIAQRLDATTKADQINED